MEDTNFAGKGTKHCISHSWMAVSTTLEDPLSAKLNNFRILSENCTACIYIIEFFTSTQNANI